MIHSSLNKNKNIYKISPALLKMYKTFLFFYIVQSAHALVRGVDASCHAQLHTDYDGPALTWGLDFKTKTAQECCDECKKRRAQGCNSWVWCPDPLCWAPDIHNHTQYECWTKIQKDPLMPAIHFQGRYPAAFRREHKTAPEFVQWTAGILL